MEKEYKEILQYEPWVDINKECQEQNIRKSSKNDLYAVGIKEFTFNEFINAVKAGHSIKRVHTFENKFIPTRYITIDIDDLDAKVSKDELKSFECDNCVILNSTSRKSL